MKLLYYECQKILSKKLFVVFSVILFLINITAFTKIQYNTNKTFIQYKEAYNLFEEEYQNKNIEDILSDISDRERIFETAYQINGLDQNIDKALKEANIKQLKKTNPQELSNYMSSIYYDNNEYLERDSYVLNQIKEECIAIKEYPKYILSIKTKAEEMVKNPMFSKTNTFAYRNIVKTVEDFEGLENIKLELGNAKGIKAVTDYQVVDLFVVVIVFLLCYYLFMEERENGLIQLLKTNKKGRHHIILSKLIVLQMITVMIVVLFYGTIIFISARIYGYGNLLRMIQSMSEFRECEFGLSCGTFLKVFLGTKVVAMLLVSVIIGSICVVANSNNEVYLSTIIFFGISYILYFFIHPVSFLNPLKYINIMSLLNVFDLYCHYTNINVFGFVFSKPIVLVWVVILTYIISNITIYIIFVHKTMMKKMQVFQKQINIIPRKHTCLFIHELYKAVISNKGYIIIAIAIMLGYHTIEKSEILFDYDTSVYNEYINQLQGKVGSEKDKFIQDESLRFENISQDIDNLNKQLETGRITEEEWQVEVQKINTFVSRKKGFNRIKEQYQYIEELKKKGIDGYFIHEMTSDYMFNNTVRDLLNAIVYSILLLLCVGSIFSKDYEGNIYKVLKTSKNGRLKLCIYKYITGYIYAIILLVLMYAPYLINVITKYPAIEWEAPIQNIFLMKDVKTLISIRCFVEAIVSMKVVGCLVLTTIMMTISQFVKKQSITICVITTIVIMPLLVQLAGSSFIQYISLNNIFIPYMIFMNNSYVYILILLIIGMFFGILGINLHCNNVISFRLKHR